MPFRTALSGLNAASAELRVIGNNVAKSRVQFADIFATANLGASSNAIGSGVRIADIAQQFSQGNISFTDNNLDLAISGQGFFRLSDNGTSVFSRAGSFGVDRSGYLVNSQDQRLTGFLADSVGNITGALGDIQLDTSDIAPQATASVDLGLNLDASAAIPAAPVTTSTLALGSSGGSPVLDSGDSPVTVGPLTLVDTYGQQVTGAQVQFTNTAGNDWDVTITGAGGTVSTATMTVGHRCQRRGASQWWWWYRCHRECQWRGAGRVRCQRRIHL